MICIDMDAMHMWGNDAHVGQCADAPHAHAHDMHTHMPMQHAVHCAYIHTHIYIYVRQYRNIFPMWALARYARHGEIAIEEGESPIKYFLTALATDKKRPPLRSSEHTAYDDDWSETK